MKKKKTLMIIGVVVAILILGSIIFYNIGISAVSSSDEEVIVHIEKGSSSTQILDALDDAKLVNNKLCAKIFLKLHSYDHLQANTYIFNKNMSLSEMFDVMNDPDIKYILKSELTIKDGNTIPQVAEVYAKILNISTDDVIKQWADKEYLKTLIDEYWFIDETILNSQLMYPLEGYLYPETYYITDQNPTLEDMTKVALDMMDKKLTPYKDQIEKMNWAPHEFLTFVSVVERESLFDDDKPIIAGVFINRLNKGMALQSDITVNYALQRTGVKVSNKQTQTDSPYNTYKYVGLPVGPISTVTEDTMKACLNYTKHNYYYFFAKEDGTVIYSETYEQHEKAVKENKWY